jgi:hypothetical protein
VGRLEQEQQEKSGGRKSQFLHLPSVMLIFIGNISLIGFLKLFQLRNWAKK